jgi:guanine nucleotide-binding protein subunit alpha
MPTKVHRRGDENPFEMVLAPPEGETDEQRQVRLLLEKEEKEISDSIDEQLSREKALEKKGPRPVKILLLGASFRSPCTPRSMNALQARANQVCLQLMCIISAVC